MIPSDRAMFASQAEVLRRSFEAAFWSDNVSTYALALVAVSVPAASARPTLDDVPDERYRFRGERAISGLNTPCLGIILRMGIRTAASSAARSNCMGHHKGGVRPHDHALIEREFSRSGFLEEAAPVFSGIFDAAVYFDLHRPPKRMERLALQKNISDKKRWSGFGPVGTAENQEFEGLNGKRREGLSL
jgi:glycogen debranching enzyme